MTDPEPLFNETVRARGIHPTEIIADYFDQLRVLYDELVAIYRTTPKEGQ